jgi:hypothetical protein
MRQTTTSGLADTASAAVAAGVAPWATRGPVLAGLRFQTVVGCPALRKAAARAVPIMPRPRTETGGRLLGMGVLLSVRVGCGFVAAL